MPEQYYHTTFTILLDNQADIVIQDNMTAEERDTTTRNLMEPDAVYYHGSRLEDVIHAIRTNNVVAVEVTYEAYDYADDF